MDTNCNEYKKHFNSFRYAMETLIERTKTNHVAYTEMQKLFDGMLSEFDKAHTGKKCDWQFLCKILRKLANVASKSLQYRNHAGKFMKLHDYIKKETGPAKNEKSQAGRGVPCINMKTGLIYISKV
jgi:hypothetical protein